MHKPRHANIVFVWKFCNNKSHIMIIKSVWPKLCRIAPIASKNRDVHPDGLWCVQCIDKLKSAWIVSEMLYLISIYTSHKNNNNKVEIVTAWCMSMRGARGEQIVVLLAHSTTAGVTLAFAQTETDRWHTQPSIGWHHTGGEMSVGKSESHTNIIKE